MSRDNAMCPELDDQTWLQGDRSGVQIVELNSSTNSDSSKKSTENLAQTWNNLIHERFEEIGDDYRINEEARNRRRMRNIEDYVNDFPSENYSYREIPTNSNEYSRYDFNTNRTSFSHKMNCYALLNKNLYTNNNSPDNDGFETIEILEVDDNEMGSHGQWHHVYNDDEGIILYDPSTDLQKKTTWLYSYKNKRLLSENDFEIINIPSKDTTSTSTSCCISDEDQKLDEKVNFRKGSPVPATYIPRLDLSLVQTLSTVTELSEPTRNQSNASDDKVKIRPKNNWLQSTDGDKPIERSNIVDWMALSPRENKRSINTDFVDKLKVNGKDKNANAKEIRPSDEVHIKTNELSIIHADIHGNEIEYCNGLSTPPINELEITKIDVCNKVSDKLSFGDANDVDSNSSDCEVYVPCNVKRDSLQDEIKITKAIEKLCKNNWVTEKCDKETMVYDYEFDKLENNTKYYTENVSCDSARKKSLQTKPITSTLPVLYLPSGCSSRKTSWLQRLSRCIQCCK